MNRYINSLVILFLFFSSCDRQVLKSYYFNTTDFEKGKVYVYTNQNDTNQIHYSHIYTKDSLLITEGLDEEKRPIEIFVEKIENKKTLMLDYYYINYDSIGNEIKMPSTIFKNNVYSFYNFKDSLIWSVEYERDFKMEQMDKIRTVLKLDVEQIIDTKSYNCVIFRDYFIITIENSKEKEKFYQDSYYAQNYGLVRFVRTLPTGDIMDYQLTDIIEEKN